MSNGNNNNEDTEITLGTGKMLGLFFGLVILCAVFFGMGYRMGRTTVTAAPELLPSPSTSSDVHSNANKPSVTPGPAPQTEEVVQQTSVPPAYTPATSTQNGSSTAPQSAPGASPLAAPDAGYFVQVAAVSKQEDAQALVESLKGHQYSAIIASSQADKLFHVQVGPFANIKDAEATRVKLVGDGYSPILKK